MGASGGPLTSIIHEVDNAARLGEIDGEIYLSRKTLCFSFPELLRVRTGRSRWIPGVGGLAAKVTGLGE